MSLGSVLLPDELREELEASIEASQPAWQSFAQDNREEPGSGGYSLALKYVDPQWAALYRGPNRGFMIGKSHHTWGDGVYVTGVEEPLSTAIYGRVGVVARFDPTDWRCFDARELANRALYTSWLHAQPDYSDAVLTVHNGHFLHGMRNDFREHFQIDVVLFGPDEVDSAGAYTRSTDTWMAVSDWDDDRKLKEGYSGRFLDARVALLVEEEFRTTDPGLSREALLRISGTPPPAAVVASQARAAYAAAEIVRVES